MSIYSDPILVTLSYDDPFISLQTLDSKHGKSQRFFLSKEALSHDGSTTESDLTIVCNVREEDEDIQFRTYWLHDNCDSGLYGYHQLFTVPKEKVSKVLAGETIKHLSYSSREKAKLEFTPTAHKAIADTNKLQRHALRKFLRDNFNYFDNLIINRDSWVNGFYFFSTHGNYDGGIVPHSSEFRTSDGMTRHKVYYGLHT